MSWPTRPAGFLRGKATVPAGPPVLLADLDFREPHQQAFPINVAAFNALGCPNAGSPDEIWLCDEASGSLVGEVISESLLNVGAVSHQHSAVGFYDGTDMFNKPCVSTRTQASSGFLDLNTTYGDIGAGDSVAVLIVFRSSIPPTSTFDIVRQSGASQYRISYSAGGNLVFRFQPFTLSIMEDHADGAWHYAWLVVDRANSITRGFTDLGSISGGNVVGALGGGGNFGIGVFATGLTVQVAYLAVFKGINADGIAPADGAVFWRHATKNTTPLLDTYDRASVASAFVGNDAGFGCRVAKYSGIASIAQVAHGRAAAFGHASELGAQFEDAANNYALYSEDLTNGVWTPSSATVAVDDSEAPDGMKTADKLTSSANNAKLRQTVSGLTASTSYVLSFFVRQNVARSFTTEVLDGATGTVQRAIVTQTGSTGIHGNGLTEWDRYELAFTTAGGETSVAIDLYTAVKGAGAAAEIQHLWGVQVEQDQRTSYIPTRATAITRPAVEAALTNPTSNTYMLGPEGETEATFVRETDVGTLVDTGSGDQDRRHVLIDPGGAVRFTAYNTAGGTAQNFAAGATSPDTEHVVRARWRAAGGFESHAESADILIDGTRQAGAVTTWAAGAGVGLDRVRPGERRTLGLALGGLLARLRIWNKPRPDIP